MGLELYLGAFLDLSSCRPVGWGVSRIPWTAIADYAEAYRFSGEQRDDLFFYVRAMDAAFIEYHEQRAKKK